MAQRNIAEHNHQRLAIEKRSEELAQTLRQRREGLHVEQAADLIDNLLLAADRELEVERLTREHHELSLVQRALDNLASGVYGVCADCEEQISAKRLAVMPWAIRCITCQERFETEEKEMHYFDERQSQAA